MATEPQRVPESTGPQRVPEPIELPRPRPGLRVVGTDGRTPVRAAGVTVDKGLLRALAAAMTIRLATFGVGMAATYWLGERLHRKPPRVPADVLLREHPLAFVQSAWRHWDAVWFLRVAEHGYGVRRAAFFPLYPLLVRLLGHAMGQFVLAGIIVSLVCFALATVVLYRLVREEFDARVALWTVLLLAAAPTSLYFQAVYSESLFLLLTVGCFAAARGGRWWLAGGLGLLASLTRSAGVVLLAPLAWMWIEQRRGRPLSLPGGPARPRLLNDRPPGVLSLGSLLLVPAGVGMFMAYTLVRFGDALLFVSAERHWHRYLAPPTTAVSRGAEAAAHSIGHIIATPSVYLTGRLTWRDQWLTFGNLAAFLALLFALAVLVVCWRRLPAAYTILAVASLLLPLSYPTHSTPLLSMPRFVLVAFPLFVGLAVVLARHRVARWTVLAMMLAGLVLLTVMYTNGMWVS